MSKKGKTDLRITPASYATKVKYKVGNHHIEARGKSGQMRFTFGIKLKYSGRP